MYRVIFHFAICVVTASLYMVMTWINWTLTPTCTPTYTHTHKTRPSAEVGDRELTLSTMGLSNSAVKDGHTRKKKHRDKMPSFLPSFLRYANVLPTRRHATLWIIFWEIHCKILHPTRAFIMPPHQRWEPNSVAGPSNRHNYHLMWQMTFSNLPVPPLAEDSNTR